MFKEKKLKGWQFYKKEDWLIVYGRYFNKKFEKIVKIVNDKLEFYCKGNDGFSIYLQELTEQIASSVMVDIFFGGGHTKIDSFEIDGQSISSFMRVLLYNLGEQALDPVSFLLGQDIPERNLR